MESSKDMEVASEAMEETSAVATSLPTKRKAESDPVEEEEEESDESDGYYYYHGLNENGELVYRPKNWKYPEWGVDSYDEREYDPEKELNPFSDEENQEKWCRFKRQLIDNKGFQVDPDLSIYFGYERINTADDLEASCGWGQTYRGYFEELASLCLKKYNEENSIKNGFNVEFAKVLRGTYKIGPVSKFYITFMAKEKPDVPLVEYQAKAWCTFKQGENYPILCRPAPPFKR